MREQGWEEVNISSVHTHDNLTARAMKAIDLHSSPAIDMCWSKVNAPPTIVPSADAPGCIGLQHLQELLPCLLHEYMGRAPGQSVVGLHVGRELWGAQYDMWQRPHDDVTDGRFKFQPCNATVSNDLTTIGITPISTTRLIDRWIDCKFYTSDDFVNDPSSPMTVINVQPFNGINMGEIFCERFNKFSWFRKRGRTMCL
ncbi:hypothetical protein M405DRAFT_886469 [Rhizopogon salebrosus TDB-379]|nr:hypothetical protein M405DRAFT_886469 [Rhizopogon salebrosus TDB-379]